MPDGDRRDRWQLLRELADAKKRVSELEKLAKSNVDSDNKPLCLTPPEDPVNILFGKDGPDAVLLTKSDGTILAANHAATNLFDMNEDEICAAGREGLADLSDERLPELLEKRKREGSTHGFLRFRRGDGKLFEGEIYSGEFKGRLDEPLNFLIIRDLDERKKVGLALKRSEQRFKSLLEDVEIVAVQGYDEERRVIYWNFASEMLYGYSREEALGRRLEELIIPDGMREIVVSSVKNWIGKDIKIPAGELLLKHKDGSAVPVYSSHVMQVDNSGKREMYCVDVPLKEVKKAEEVLRRMLSEKEAMLQEIHHRVKNNLTVILGLLDMTGNRTESPEAKEVIREIHSKINSMALIHSGLYNEDSLEEIRISRFAKSLISNLISLYGNNEVEYECECNDVRLGLEKAVPVGLVLNEIFTNAFKYAFNNRKGLLRCIIGECNDGVKIEIIDNGPGLPKDLDPLETKTLGFKLIRDVVHLQLNGEFFIESDSGTRITLKFPA
jgi:PAS domain S-box-containing protein